MAHGNWCDHAVQADAFRQLFQCLLVEFFTRLIRIALDFGKRQLGDAVCCSIFAQTCCCIIAEQIGQSSAQSFFG